MRNLFGKGKERRKQFMGKDRANEGKNRVIKGKIKTITCKILQFWTNFELFFWLILGSKFGLRKLAIHSKV